MTHKNAIRNELAFIVETLHTSGFPYKKGKPLKDGSSMDEVIFYQCIIRATLHAIAAGKKTK
jgi:hypothetical protein